VPLILLSGAWVAGIFLGARLSLPPALIATGIIPLPLLFFCRQHRKRLILLSLCLIAFFAAVPYSYSNQHRITESHLRFYNDRGVIELKGMVTQDPEVRDRSARLRLSAMEIKQDGEWREVQGDALVFTPRYPAYQYGDVLRITGELETPASFSDFDYRGYLAHQGIYTVMFYPQIEIEARGKGSKLLAWVYTLRNRLAQTLATALPEPQASLAQGIILGIRGNIPPAVRDDFVQSGTAHLLAISGLHLGIVAGILLSLGLWLFGRQHYLYIWLALGFIWLYALLTGLHPPVVRGAIMASLFLAAELLGRQRRALTALAFAAAVMVGISPYILGDAAFQLSFLAMAGLVLLFPSLQALGKRVIKNTLGEEGTLVSLASTASDSFAVTLAALIMVWPAVSYYFGIISIVGPLATFLSLPALPGIIIAGALTGGLGLIALPVAQVVGWLAWLFLSYLLLVVSTLAATPLSFIEVSPFSPAWIWLYYLALAVAIFLGRRRFSSLLSQLKSGGGRSIALLSQLPKKWALPPLVLAAALVSVAAATLPDDKLHVSFLDVGQGDAILIRQGSQQVLIDGGPSPQAINLELGEQMPFWDRTIELVVLTHPDHDHLAGLVEILKRFQVRKVLYPDLSYDSPLYAEWLKLIAEKKISYTLAQAGQQIDLGDGVIIEVLNPRQAHSTSEDVDNNSVVLRLNAGRVSFLLTGDIGMEAELELIAGRALKASTVLKVAHHGSATSTSPQFLAVASPRLAVISVGAGNRFGHPASEVLDRLERKLGTGNIYRTDELGTIEFITDGKRLWVAKPRQTGEMRPNGL